MKFKSIFLWFRVHLICGTVELFFRKLGCSFLCPAEVYVSAHCDWTKNTVYSELCPKMTDKSGVETNEITFHTCTVKLFFFRNF